MPKLNDYLTLSEAADFVGVPVYTLRNWVDGGKLTVHRNPMNNYRLLRRTELEELLRKVERSGKKASIVTKTRRPK